MLDLRLKIIILITVASPKFIINNVMGIIQVNQS